MTVHKRQIERAPPNENKTEMIFSGRAVSRGIAIGKIVCLHAGEKKFLRVGLKKNQIETEIERFRAAVRLAKKQIEKLIAQKKNSVEIKTGIFDAHLLILDDVTLLKAVEDIIERRKSSAEWSVKIVTDAIIAEYKLISNEHLRERYIDLQDVSDRLLIALSGGGKSDVPFPENAIVVAGEIKPSTLIELSEINPQAIITETGGWTSHTFILAREMNVPAVTGVERILSWFETGDSVIVDGYEGKIILHPSEKKLRDYKTTAERFQTGKHTSYGRLSEPLATLDRREITVCANVDLPTVYAQAKKYGARGIGLYRSEFLFNQNNRFPDRDEQLAAYRAIADAAGKDGVRIRTFDLSAEQTYDDRRAKESNPALGLRAIRLGLAESKQLRVQLSALLEAAANQKIDIILPMISDVSEILQVRQILNEEKARLQQQKVDFGSPLLGAMIEVPSAVFMVEEIARSVDFLSLGTNDLVQYLLAADRDNPAVADWFRTLHPAVIRAIKKVLAAADAADVPIVVCGEMAGSPYYAPVLIGLGANILSMNVHSILRVGRIIDGIAFEEAAELAKQLERCETAQAVENAVKNYFGENWSHLFSPDMMSPPPKK